jgi:hypothetical protein
MMKSKINRSLFFLLAILLILGSLGIHFAILYSAFRDLPLKDTEYLNAAEEHFDIGYNLYRTGSLTKDNHFNTERPPAYPIYVAGTLHFRDFIIESAPRDASGHIGMDKTLRKMLQNDHVAVVLANFPIAFVCGILLYLLLREYVSEWIALAVIVLYSLNIHFLAIINKYDYSMMEGMIILLLAIQFLGYLTNPQKIRLIFLGITLGVSCLFRPVYLLFPFFFGAYDLFFGQKQVKSAILRGLAVAGIALLVMVPNIIRNFNVAHKLILVSEQGGVEVYHNSVVSLWLHPEYASYGKVWTEHGWPLMKNALGLSEYSPSIWYTDTAAVSGVYWEGAIQTILRQPQVLATNVLYNIKQISFYDLNYWGGKYFKHNEKHAAGLQAFQVFDMYLLIAGSLAIFIALFYSPKNRLYKTLWFISVQLVLSYSMVYYYPRYNYIKLPIFLISIALAMNWLWNQKKFGRFGKLIVIVFFLASTAIFIAPLYYFYIYL